MTIELLDRFFENFVTNVVVVVVVAVIVAVVVVVVVAVLVLVFKLVAVVVVNAATVFNFTVSKRVSAHHCHSDMFNLEGKTVIRIVLFI